MPDLGALRKLWTVIRTARYRRSIIRPRFREDPHASAQAAQSMIATPRQPQGRPKSKQTRALSIAQHDGRERGGCVGRRRLAGGAVRSQHPQLFVREPRTSR